MGSGFGDNLLGENDVGVNELVKDIFRRKFSALARVPIDHIPWRRIKELAAKYVVHNPHSVLCAKTETPAHSAPIPLGQSHAKFWSEYTVALQSVFVVKQRSTLLMKQQFSVQ